MSARNTEQNTPEHLHRLLVKLGTRQFRSELCAAPRNKPQRGRGSPSAPASAPPPWPPARAWPASRQRRTACPAQVQNLNYGGGMGQCTDRDIRSQPASRWKGCLLRPWSTQTKILQLRNRAHGEAVNICWLWKHRKCAASFTCRPVTAATFMHFRSNQS